MMVTTLVMKKLLTSVVLALCVGTLVAQGKLERATQGLTKDAPSGSTSSAPSLSGRGDQSSGLVDAFAQGVLYVSFNALFGEVQPRAFIPYAYADNIGGEYCYLGEVADVKLSKLVISNTTTFQSGSTGNDVKLNYRFLPFLGLDVNHLHLFDRLDRNYHLGISTMMLNFYRIREKRVTGYWGLGATYVGREVNTMGFGYNLGLDIYVANPVSIGLQWKQSFISESSINELRILGRYHINRFAIQGGYINYRIGDVGFPSASIGLEFSL
jgi:hypothetical protein